MLHENNNHHSYQNDGSANRNSDDRFQNSKYQQDRTDENESGEEFPGYPHYPSSEDIMNPTNKVERVPVDVENLAPSGKVPSQQPGKNPGAAESNARDGNDDEVKIVPGTEADVTKEDLRLLNATEGSYGDTSSAATITGDDLDVPGADEDDPNEDIGEEDEENNYYSLGGDNHENLEEDRT